MKPIATVAVLWIVAAIFLIQEIDAFMMKTKIYHRTRGYIKLPKSTYEPSIKKDWVKVDPGKNYNYPIDFYCPKNDSRVCILYDKLGNPAGIQLSFLEEDFTDVHPRDYNMSAVKGYIKTNFFGKPAYSLIVYFTNPCVLSESGRMYTNEVAEALWIKIDNQWVSIDKCQPNGPRMGDFYMQGCYPRLGTIFVYKFNRYATCNDALLFYASYNQGSLVEFGLLNVGRGGSPGPKKDWYAHPTIAVLQELLPAPPPCFRHYWKYGFTSLQVYLTDDPDSIKCISCKA